MRFRVGEGFSLQPEYPGCTCPLNLQQFPVVLRAADIAGWRRTCERRRFAAVAPHGAEAVSGPARKKKMSRFPAVKKNRSLILLNSLCRRSN